MPLQCPPDCVATLVLDQKCAATAEVEVTYHAPAFFLEDGRAGKPYHHIETSVSQPSEPFLCP
jgi:hypothetical protein